MAKISDLVRNVGGFWTVDECEAYGPEGITLTIKECLDKVDVGEKGESKPALRFVEHAKLLIANKTRCEQLSELFGIATDPAGQKVKLVVENVKVGNRKMPMISIQAP